MKFDLQLECEHIDITTNYYNKLVEVNLIGIEKLEIDENIILDKFQDLRLLFEKIIEKDEDILHDYLTYSGYIFNKN